MGRCLRTVLGPWRPVWRPSGGHRQENLHTLPAERETPATANAFQDTLSDNAGAAAAEGRLGRDKEHSALGTGCVEDNVGDLRQVWPQKQVGDLDRGAEADHHQKQASQQDGTSHGHLRDSTNEDVASFYKHIFRSKKKSKADGPAKLDPQVMAVALAVYVTDSDLAGGGYAASYGFEVTTSGVGGSYFDIDAAVGDGTGETLFGTDAASLMSVMDILRNTDERSSNGNVFEDDGDGVIEADEALMRVLANELFTAINESGDIG